MSTNWLAQAEHGGFYQAVANGIYEKYGLAVTIRQGGPGINSKALLLADKVDFNIGGSAGALNFVASEVPFKAVAAIFQKDPQAMISHEGHYNNFSDLTKAPTILVSKDGQFSFWKWMVNAHGFKDEQVKPYAYNLAQFLQDEKMQEQAQEDYMLLQAGYLKEHVNDLEGDGTWGRASVDAKRSMLAMSHISGARNAAKIHYGHKPSKDRDAYGTKYTDYTRDVLKNAGFSTDIVINGNAVLLSGNNGTAAKLLKSNALDKAQTNVTQVNVTPTKGGGTNNPAAVPITPTPASDDNKDRLMNKVDK